MPQLIRTPEELFRDEGKDIYLIQFEDQESESLARNEILTWLRAHLPDSRVESLAPSENSGWICGYFGTLRVDFSEPDLATFCERWETPAGKSLDPRFQCYQMLYSTWHDKVARYTPAFDRPKSIGLTKWWDTPRGIVYHQISLDQARKEDLNRHPCLHRDLWFNAVQADPLLAQIDPDGLPYGDILQDEGGQWILAYAESYRSELSDQRKGEILAWFSLPADTKMIEDGW